MAMTQEMMMTTSPLLLARLSKNEVKARNLLAQRAQDCEIQLAGQSWKVSLEPWSAGVPLSEAHSADWLVQLQWAGAPFDVRLPASVCQTLIAASYPTLDLPGLPDEFATAALESALIALMSSPRTLQRGTAHIEALQRQPVPERKLSQNFGLCLRHNTEAIYGSISTDGLGLMLMAGLVSDLPEVPNAMDADMLPMLLRVEIGVSVIGADELLALRLGDTVMMEHCWQDQEGGVWLGWDRVGIRAILNDTQLVVTHTLNFKGISMPTEDISGADSTVYVNSVPVRLAFDLGERMMPLGELKALQVGQSFDITHPLSSAVRLRVNGALIGMGELVDIDGNIGVTITSLSATAREVE